MQFMKIQLLDQQDFLACTVSTTVLQPDIRRLSDIAARVTKHGFIWVVENRDPRKDAEWWTRVRDIEANFRWDRFLVGDPITAKVHGGSLEFGSINNVGGGCHRSIALAVGILSGNVMYQPFDILLHCT